MTYFSEREGDLPAQTGDIPSPEFVQAVGSALVGLCDRWWLARGWPLTCPDDRSVIIGTDQRRFWDEALSTLNLSGREPSQLIDEPNPLRILNLIEFVHEHIARPTVVGYHDYFSHNHLRFDGQAGKDEFRAQTNALFARFGLGFRLEPNGRVVRLMSPALHDISGVGFHTGDGALDDFLETAVEKFRTPDLNVRREALEKLWDAFERLRTLEPPHDTDKKASVTALLDRAFPEPNMRARAEKEFFELGDIGNKFMIRHTEVGKIPVTANEDVDYLFHRMFAAIWRVLKATGRC